MKQVHLGLCFSWGMLVGEWWTMAILDQFFSSTFYRVLARAAWWAPARTSQQFNPDQFYPGPTKVNFKAKFEDAAKDATGEHTGKLQWVLLHDPQNHRELQVWCYCGCFPFSKSSVLWNNQLWMWKPKSSTACNPCTPVVTPLMPSNTITTQLVPFCCHYAF